MPIGLNSRAAVLPEVPGMRDNPKYCQKDCAVYTKGSCPCRICMTSALICLSKHRQSLWNHLCGKMT